MQIPHIPPTQEGLRNSLKAADTAIAADRAELDNLARGRKYRDLAAVAARLAEKAKLAQSQAEELDRLMTDAARRARG